MFSHLLLCNAPVSTGIYTIGHPLSLHDAHLISPRAVHAPNPTTSRGAGLIACSPTANATLSSRAQRGICLHGRRIPRCARDDSLCGRCARSIRSEEHTYELQSLMRI